MLEDLTPPTKKTPCKVREISVSLETKDSTIFLTAVNNTDAWKTKTLSNELRKRGILISDTAIAKHRKGLCSC